MSNKQTPHELAQDKNAGSDAEESPMNKFKKLTRRLLRVPREKLKEEEANYKSARAASRGKLRD